MQMREEKQLAKEEKQLTKKENRYFLAAKAIAQCSNHKDFHIGAIIINHHQILSVANNQIKSHPLQKKLNLLRFGPCDKSKSFTHAELAAILKVSNKNDLYNATMFVYRETLLGKRGMCRPCLACMSIIKKYHFKEIYYSTTDGFCREVLTYD